MTCFYGMLGVIIGGRMGQVLFMNPHILQTTPEIFAVWKRRHELSRRIYWCNNWRLTGAMKAAVRMAGCH